MPSLTDSYPAAEDSIGALSSATNRTKCDGIVHRMTIRQASAIDEHYQAAPLRAQPRIHSIRTDINASGGASGRSSR